MKFDKLEASCIPIFGDTSFRGDCPTESVEQITFFSWLRREYPETWGALALHPRNEGQLRGGQFRTMSRAKAEGLTPGASDVVIPGSPAFVCEMKRADHTRSTWQKGQVEYLIAAKNAGAFACLALGHKGAIDAVRCWLLHMEQAKKTD